MRKESFDLLADETYVLLLDGQVKHVDGQRMMRLGARIKAVEETFTGALKRDFEELKTNTFSTTYEQLTGRQSFYLIFKYLATDDSVRRTYNLQTLNYFEWLGDTEQAMRRWYHIATMMDRSIRGVVEAKEAEYQLCLKFKKCMLRSTERFILQDMALFVREQKGNPAVYNASWLLSRIESRITMYEDERKEEEQAAAMKGLVLGTGGKKAKHAAGAEGGKGGKGGKGKDKGGKGDGGKGKAKTPKAKGGKASTKTDWKGASNTTKTPWDGVPVEKLKAPENSKAKEMYGLANGYLACHAFNKSGCSKKDAECKFTHQMLPKEKRDALPEKPPIGKGLMRSRSASTTSSQGGKKGGKGKSKSPNSKAKAKSEGGGKGAKDRTFGKGGRPPMCCAEFASTGKCTFEERNGVPCASPAHLVGKAWSEEYKRINPDKK